MRYALVFLLACPVLAQDDKPFATGDRPADRAPPAAAGLDRNIEAQLRAGDQLREKGDLDAAVTAYRKAVAMCERALAKEEGKVVEGEEAPAAEPAPVDDGTPEGRKRVVGYYAKLLESQGDEVRYNAAAQLGEMRAIEARDALLRVLEKDKYQVARRAAAWAIGRLGKGGVPAIPVLIREIGGSFPLLGYMCDDALKDIIEAALGETVTMGYETEMKPAERLEVQKKWQEWFEKNRERLGVPATEAPAGDPGGKPAAADGDKPAADAPAVVDKPAGGAQAGAGNSAPAEPEESRKAEEHREPPGDEGGG